MELADAVLMVVGAVIGFVGPFVCFMLAAWVLMRKRRGMKEAWRTANESHTEVGGILGVGISSGISIIWGLVAIILVMLGVFLGMFGYHVGVQYSWWPALF